MLLQVMKFTNLVEHRVIVFQTVLLQPQPQSLVALTLDLTVFFIQYGLNLALGFSRGDEIYP